MHADLRVFTGDKTESSFAASRLRWRNQKHPGSCSGRTFDRPLYVFHGRYAGAVSFLWSPHLHKRGGTHLPTPLPFHVAAIITQSPLSVLGGSNMLYLTGMELLSCHVYITARLSIVLPEGGRCFTMYGNINFAEACLIGLKGKLQRHRPEVSRMRSTFPLVIKSSNDSAHESEFVVRALETRSAGADSSGRPVVITHSATHPYVRP
jgi:hypothetical protein